MSGLSRLFASACIVLLAMAGVCLAPAQASAASEPTPADKAILKVDVTFSGVDAPSEDFVVALTPLDGAPAPAEGLEQVCPLSSHTTAGRLEFTFDLSAPHEGTYRYTVEEKQGSTKGVSYSTDTYTIEFETYYVNGAWYATPFRVVKSGSSEKPDSILFANTYDQSKRQVIGDPPVRIEKSISGDKPVEDADFVFVMEPERADYPLPIPASSAVVIRDGKAYVTVHGKGIAEEIGDIVFTEPGEYNYTVRERDDRIPGYSYDDAVFTVSYSVFERAGQLECTRTVFKTGSIYTTGDKPLVFNNNYSDPGPDQPIPPVWIDGGAVSSHDVKGHKQVGLLTFRPGSAPIAYVHLVDPQTGEETDANEVVAFNEHGIGVGVYWLNPEGASHADGTVSYEVVFTPNADFVGMPRAVTMRAYDSKGNCADGVFQPVVDEPNQGSAQQAGTTASIARALTPKTGDPLSYVPLLSIAATAFALVVVAFRRKQRKNSQGTHLL